MGFASLEELRAAAGTSLGAGDWTTVTQEQVNMFADATGDHQWIHIDPERAAAGPFGRTIAHGYLTLSLLPQLASGRFRVDGARMAVNYGLNKVRFPAPLPVGTRVRGLIDIVSVEDVESGVQVTAKVTVEAEGLPKPVCVAETLTRIYP